MSDFGGEENVDTFEVSERSEETREEPQMAESSDVNEKKHLHITIVDHRPAVEGTDEESYINLRIPCRLAESGLRMVPDEKWGQVDPDLIVEMVDEGVEGEIINITEEKKTISVRVD